MKTIVTLLIIGFSALTSFGQASDYDALIDAIGIEKVNKIESENPNYLEFLQFKNRHGYYVTDDPGKEQNGFEDALEVQPVNSSFPILTPALIEGGISLLGYHFQTPSGGVKYYRIGNTGRVIGVYSDTKVEKLKERIEQ